MKPICPGSTIGILGGGQLGRMLAIEAARMGYKTAILEPSRDSPASQVATRQIQADFNDKRAVQKLVQVSDVVTFEWELIPPDTIRLLESLRILRPSGSCLSMIQDRLSQRLFLGEMSMPQASFAAASSMEELATACRQLVFPCILKRRFAGYDGKGQMSINNKHQIPLAGELLRAPCILESRIRFDKEISVILARTHSGQMVHYPVAENIHRNGILHITSAPADIPADVVKAARRIAEDIAERMNYIGVMAVEMFLVGDRLLVNEIAPRVHNSGHFTLGACLTSQFEQHIRAICGLPPGSPDLLKPAAMLNLLGDIWKSDASPDWSAIWSRPDAKLHLYGKRNATAGRKMGHVLLMGERTKDLVQRAEKMHRQLAAPANHGGKIGIPR